MRALAGLFESPAAEGRVFNVGSQAEISILDLAERVQQVTGSSSSITLVPYETAYEAGFEDMLRRRPDTSRIAETIGWYPNLDLDTILADVMKDLSEHLAT